MKRKQLAPFNRMNFRIAFLLALLGALLGWGRLHAATVTLDTEVQQLPLAGRLLFLDDAQANASLADVLQAADQGRFTPLPDSLSRGYTQAASWLQLDLHNPLSTTQSPVLRLGPQMLDVVDVYVQQSGEGLRPSDFQHLALGDHVAAADKSQRFSTMGVPFALPPQAHRRIYVRVQTTSSHLLDAELFSQDRFLQHAVNRLLWESAYAALAIGFALTTLLQALRARHLSHGFYGLLPLGLALSMISTEGLLALLLPSVAHLLNDALVGLAQVLAFGGLSLFAMRLFQTRVHHPWGHRYLQLLCLLALVSFVTSGTAWYGPWVMALMIMSMPMWLFLTWAAYQLIQRGERSMGRLFILAFTLPLLAAAISFGRYLGVVPQSDFSQFVLPVTSLLHMLLMTLLLSERLLMLEAGLRDATRHAAQERSHRHEQDQLLAMIGHEIRTPVAVIDVATQSLQVLDDSAPPQRAERYDRIRRSSRRLTMLLDLMNAHRISEIGEATLHKEPVNAVALTQEILSVIDDEDASRCVVQASADLPLVPAEQRLIQFAWLNLIANACKYSPARSPIHIRLAMAWDNHMLGIEWIIQDKGPGIPAGMEERIFQKYQRGGEYRNNPGLGLGLYLARQIIERHDGHLTLLPMAQGACFRCWLPLKTQDKEFS